MSKLPNIFSPIVFAAILALPFTVNADLINELQPNPDGSDPATQDIELIGTPGATYGGFLISIDSDVMLGTIDRLTRIDGTYDASGRAVITIDDLENPSFTFVFSSGDGGGLGTDLDVDGDGVLDDISGFGTVFDAVSVPDNVADSGYYAGQLGGTDFVFTGAEPELIFRELTTGAWIAVNNIFDASDGIFGADGTEYFVNDFLSDPLLPTFGADNPAFIPEPSTAGILAVGVIAGMGMRRNRRK